MKLLKGIKVLDLSRLLPGPFCTKILSDLGCEVTKVSLPRLKDPVEGWPAAGWLHDDKKNLFVDFQKEPGKAKLIAIVKRSDVLVEGFRPGALSKLGLGYKDLAQVNPRLIYCSITGYGQAGPYKRWAGHDLNYTALSGITALAGNRLQGTQISDFSASLYAAVGILAALVNRHKTGKGRFLDIAMLDCAFSLNILAMADLLSKDGVKFKGSELLFGAEPFYNLYKTKDNRCLAVAALELPYRERLLDLIGRKDLAGLKGDDLRRALQSVFLAKTLKEWRELLEGKEVCVSGVLTLAEALQNEQLKTRGIIKRKNKKYRLATPIRSIVYAL